MQVEEKNRQLNEDAETIEEKNELQTGKKKHRKNNFAAGMAVGAAAAIMGFADVEIAVIDAHIAGRRAQVYISAVIIVTVRSQQHIHREERRQQHHLQSSHRIRRPSQMS